MATRKLKRGCTGSDVKSLQKKLKKLGYYSGSIDGSFGPATYAAVRKFQKANGLKADGIVGPKTRAALAGKTKKKKKSTVKKSEKSKSANSKSTTHNIGKWNGHEFIVSSNLIRSFTKLQIKGSSELKSGKDSGQGKVKRKGANPTEISMTIKLNAFVGIDVQKEAMDLVSEASLGEKGYFYIGKKKLVSCKLMLTEATVKEVEINIGGTWTSAEVSVTMKQCNKGGKSGSSSKSSKKKRRRSNKVSVRSSSARTSGSSGAAASTKTGTTKATKSGVDAISGAAPTASKVKAGTSAVKRIASNAKKATVATKSGTGAVNVSSSSRRISGMTK